MLKKMEINMALSSKCCKCQVELEPNGSLELLRLDGNVTILIVDAGDDSARHAF